MSTPAGSSSERRVQILQWMDHWVDPLLILLAASAIPLIIIETGDPSPADHSMVIAGTWGIWGAFTTNFVVRMLFAERRRDQLAKLAGDLTLVVALPIFSVGERQAIPAFALLPLIIIMIRTLQRGRVLRKTGYKLRTNPIRVVAFVVPLVWLLSAALIWRFERQIGTVDSVGDSLWWGIVTLATVGYGDISPKTTAGRLVAAGVMIVGIGMFSIVTAQLAERLVSHRSRAGHSEVLEKDHTLILGWSQMVITIVAELVVANRNRSHAYIVVMADMDTEEMHEAIVSHVPELERASTTLMCRSGDPTDPIDIARCHPDTARSIIIVDPTKQDAPVVRALLALLHSKRPARHGIPVVAEIDDPATAASLEMAFPDQVTVVNPTTFIARTAAQSCRAAGVAHTYLDLLGFEGSEMYVFHTDDASPVAAAVGRRYRDLLVAFGDACLVGIVNADGTTDLNPPMDTVIEPGQSLLAIALDDSRIKFSPVDTGEPAETLPEGDEPPPEHIMIFGWNELGPLVVRELDGYLSDGSRITLVTHPDIPVRHVPEPGDLASCEIEAVFAEGRDVTGIIDRTHADHVMVLCYREGCSVAEADARALVTTLQVRQAIDHSGHDTTVVTELLDQRDVALAPPESAGDFIVSDRLISLLLAQLSEDSTLKSVFDDLLDPEGAEVYCKPSSRYCTPGEPTTFVELVRSARRRNETAIGYRNMADAHDSSRGFGIVVNPSKSANVTLADQDQLIVLAEDDR